jgi:ribosomal protein S27E
MTVRKRQTIKKDGKIEIKQAPRGELNAVACTRCGRTMSRTQKGLSCLTCGTKATETRL